MQDIDETIRGLFTKLDERKAKLKQLKSEVDSKWKTNGTFRPIGSTSVVNIQTANADTIAELAVQLSMMAAAKKDASAQLGVQIEPKFAGYSVDDWFADFKKRLATINVREETNAIETLEARLNQLLSPEERRRIEVALLAKELG